MFTEAQIQYLENVLGASVNYFAAPLKQPGPAQNLTHSIVVLTPSLIPEEAALLSKILGSVQLSESVHVQSAEFKLAIGMSARHVVTFGGERPAGRHQLPTGTWWSVCPLGEMLGSGPAVSEKKKATWVLMQQLVKELST